jgi:hypothetical protein
MVFFSFNGGGKEPLSLLPIIKRRRKEPLERTSFPLTYYQTAKERTSRKNLFPSYLLSNGEGKNLSKEPLSLLPIIKRRRKEPLSAQKQKGHQRIALMANVLRFVYANFTAFRKALLFSILDIKYRPLRIFA